MTKFATDGHSLFSLLVVDEKDGSVEGIVTARDLLRALLKTPAGSDSITEAMTKAEKIVHVTPSDEIQKAIVVMSELGVSHLPVIESGQVKGVLSLQDISTLFVEGSRGGKESFVRHILPRKGGIAAAALPHQQQQQQPGGTGGGAGNPRLSPSFSSSSSSANPVKAPLFTKTAYAALARAKKVETHSEDAFFCTSISWPLSPADAATLIPSERHGATPTAPTRIVTFAGVFDGVGSWHELDVDPRAYAEALAQRCQESVWRAAAKGLPPPSTQQVLKEGHEAVKSDGVIGSSTATVFCLDSATQQISITCLGDSGLILLRDTDVTRVGSLLRGGTAAGIRPGWRVSARATQQLRGFNQPYQLGFAGPENSGRFEEPEQAETLVLPVHDEDIVVCASDGLFDNMDEEDILAILKDWDQNDLRRRMEARRVNSAAVRGESMEPHPHPHLAGGGLAAHAALLASAPLEPPGFLVDSRSPGLRALAEKLAHKAKEYSMDRMRDGPFSRLAKENDVLWSHGGRPDDVTVIVCRVSALKPLRLVPTDAEERKRFEEVCNRATELK